MSFGDEFCDTLQWNKNPSSNTRLAALAMKEFRDADVAFIIAIAYLSL